MHVHVHVLAHPHTCINYDEKNREIRLKTNENFTYFQFCHRVTRHAYILAEYVLNAFQQYNAFQLNLLVVLVVLGSLQLVDTIAAVALGFYTIFFTTKNSVGSSFDPD